MNKLSHFRYQLQEITKVDTVYDFVLPNKSID
jgi:hypothetical protein